MEICDAFVLEAQSQSAAQRRHDRTDIYIGMKIITNLTYPVNMPDPIRKRFDYGQLWPLRPACSQNRPGSYLPDLTSRIRFISILFPNKAWIILRKLDSDPIWMAWSGLGQTHLVWKQAGVRESSGRDDVRFVFHIVPEFNAALRPQRPYELLVRGSPGRPPLL